MNKETAKTFLTDATEFAHRDHGAKTRVAAALFYGSMNRSIFQNQ